MDLCVVLSTICSLQSNKLKVSGGKMRPKAKCSLMRFRTWLQAHWQTYKMWARFELMDEWHLWNKKKLKKKLENHFVALDLHTDCAQSCEWWTKVTRDICTEQQNAQSDRRRERRRRRRRSNKHCKKTHQTYLIHLLCMFCSVLFSHPCPLLCCEQCVSLRAYVYATVERKQQQTSRKSNISSKVEVEKSESNEWQSETCRQRPALSWPSYRIYQLWAQVKSFAFHRILTVASSRCVSCLSVSISFSGFVFPISLLLPRRSFTFACPLDLSHLCQQKVLTIASMPWQKRYTRQNDSAKIISISCCHFLCFACSRLLSALVCSPAAEMQVFFISRFQGVCLQPKPFLSGFLFIYFCLCRFCCCCGCLWVFFSLFIKT